MAKPSPDLRLLPPLSPSSQLLNQSLESDSTEGRDSQHCLFILTVLSLLFSAAAVPTFDCYTVTCEYVGLLARDTDLKDRKHGSDDKSSSTTTTSSSTRVCTISTASATSKSATKTEDGTRTSKSDTATSSSTPTTSSSKSCVTASASTLEDKTKTATMTVTQTATVYP